MTLALQLVAYNSSPHLPRLFASLKAQTLQGWTLHVRDQSPDPAEAARVAAALAASGLPCVFEAGPNLGFAGGHGALFARHAAEAVATVNPDVELEPDYYERLVAALEARPGDGAVQGFLFRGRRGSATVDSAGLRVLGAGDVRDLGAGEPSVRWAGLLDAGQPFPVFGVSGAASVYRRAALAAAASTHGPFFDTRFFLYKEDVELAIRLFRAGYAASCVPMARAFHLRAVGRTGLVARARDEFARSTLVRTSSYAGQWRIYLLHGEPSMPPRAWLRTLFAEAGRSVALLLPPTLFVRAWGEILRDARSLLASRREYRRNFPRRWRLFTSETP